ncbi:hypothetical protein MBLNU457_6466t1 [Dothideomycetes sp. NU457]
MSTASMPIRLKDSWMDTSESDRVHNTFSATTATYSSSHHYASPKANISRHRTKIDVLKGSSARRSHATGMHALFTCAKNLDKESEMLTARSRMSISPPAEFGQWHQPNSPSLSRAAAKDLPRLDIGAAQAAVNDISDEDWTGDDEFFPACRQSTAGTASTFQSPGSPFFPSTQDGNTTDTSDSCKLQKAARHRKKVITNQPQTPITRSNTAYDGDVEDDEGPITPLSPDVEIHRGSARHRFARKKKKALR